MAPSSARAKIQAMRHEQARRERRQRTILIGTGTLAVLLIAAIVVWAIARAGTSPTAIPGLISYQNLSRNHVDGPVTYAQTPPAGGEHSPIWLNCGIYTQPVPNENAVHSLEHGAIWITYQPNLPPTQLAVLRNDVAHQPYGLLSPYPGLPTPIVATVWGVQLKLTDANDPRLKEFITQHADASKAPEPHGECTGGTGTPTN